MVKRTDQFGNELPADSSDPSEPPERPQKEYGISEWPVKPPERLHEPMPPPEYLPIPEPMPANPPPPPPPPLRLHEPMPEDEIREPGGNGRSPNLVKLVLAPILLFGAAAAGFVVANGPKDTGVATPTNAIGATATAPLRSLDGTYAVTSTVTQSTVGRGVTCTNDPVEWVVTSALVGQTQTLTVVSTNGTQFTLGLQGDGAFNVSDSVGDSGTSTLFGRFNGVADPPTVSGESILTYRDSGGQERTCRLAFTGARIR
jgi:hypothetical protein